MHAEGRVEGRRGRRRDVKVVAACGGLVNDVEAKVVGVRGGAVSNVGMEAHGAWVLKGGGSAAR
ncbi:hypothetical protein GCM10009827_047750 [Dactylosporangium maewongense]|uniref:Uncharacterized protein n=1 Tax=Dactylosporangium maewongense TaxID=634393 RepID=A0ABN2ARW2_9ACTN